MKLNKYAAFTKAVELGSVTAAAGSLGITQSAATQLVAALEKEFDCKLMKRNKAGIVLSKEGSYLLPYVQSVVDANKILESAAAHLHQDNNIVRIGISKDFPSDLFTKIKSAFAKKRTGIKLKVTEYEPDEIDAICSQPYPFDEDEKGEFSRHFDLALVTTGDSEADIVLPAYEAATPAAFEFAEFAADYIYME